MKTFCALALLTAMLGIPALSPVLFPAAASAQTATPILPGVAVNVPAGDYLLSAMILPTATGLGQVNQLVGGTGNPLRTAEFSMTMLNLETVTADVRVTGPNDTFSVASGASTIVPSLMTLTPASWGYVVRGQYIVAPDDTTLTPQHGLDYEPTIGATNITAAITAYPKQGVDRILVDEQCWESFFTTAQASASCNQFNGNGLTGAQAYQAQVESSATAVINSGKLLILCVKNPGDDDPTYSDTNRADQIAPDQHTLSVYDDLVSLYGQDQNVIFETENEPTAEPGTTYSGLTANTLWDEGGTVTYNGISWTAPGVHQEVARIRNDGTNNIVMVEGLSWGEDLLPIETDPVDGTNIMYSFHAYNPASQTIATVLYNDVAPVLNPYLQYQYAGFLSEFGTTYNDGGGYTLGSNFYNSAMGFAGLLNAGWVAYGWLPYAWNTYGMLASLSPLVLLPKANTILNAF